jgi:hypothetical protein
MERATEDDKELLADLLTTPPTPAISVVKPAPAEPPKEPRSHQPRTNKKSTYNKCMDSLAYAGAVFIACMLWFFGASFTLEFLRWAGVNIAKLHYAQWLIPATITACELQLWPRASATWHKWAVWLSVLAFDVGTSFAGAVQWGAGKTIPLFIGVTVPNSGTILWALALGAGLIFAFIPEKIARWAVKELVGVWN